MPKGRTTRGTTITIPASRKAMTKTTKRGAYQSSKVKVMANRRAPFTEFKRRETYELALQNRTKTDIGIPAFADNYPDTTDPVEIANADAFHFIPLTSFTRNMRGLRDNQCIGSSVFSRYINLKIRVDFPQGADQIINPVRVYLVHGVVKNPLNATSLTAVPIQSVSANYFQDHIENSVKEYWRDGEEDLRWNQNENNDNIKILGKRLLKTKRLEQTTNLGPIATTQLAADGTSAIAPVISLTGPADVHAGCSWKIFKKIHFAEGAPDPPDQQNPPDPTPPQAYTPDAVDDENLYPNWIEWTPFSFLYMPDHDRMYKVNPDKPLEVGLETKLRLSYNDIHIYSDS